jgi:hypothetical protein
MKRIGLLRTSFVARLPAELQQKTSSQPKKKHENRELQTMMPMDLGVQNFQIKV